MKKITDTLSSEPIVMVRFLQDGATYFFGSLAAIYEMFTADEIGCPLTSLWQRGVLDDGRAFTTARCTIVRVSVYRKRNARPRKNN